MTLCIWCLLTQVNRDSDECSSQGATRTEKEVHRLDPGLRASDRRGPSLCLPLSHSRIHSQVQTITSASHCCLSALTKQLIRENFSRIRAELGGLLNMNHDNVSGCLCDDENYQDEWRRNSHPLYSSQRRSALRFLMLRDLLVITAADKQSWRK